MNFKTGDVVIVKKPKDVDAWPSWVDGMDVFEGTVQTISDYKVCEGVEVAFHFEGNGDCYIFNTKWLIPYDEPPFEGNV